MKFTIKGIDSKKFVLFHQDAAIAQLNYKGWSSVTSEISLNDGEIFNLDAVSMWKSKFQLKKEQKVVSDYEMNWKGHFLFQSKFDDVPQNFIFKTKGFWGKSYVLTDEKENQLAEITPNFSWKGFKTEYVIETASDFDKLTYNTILMLIMMHCIRYYITMVAVVT